MEFRACKSCLFQRVQPNFTSGEEKFISLVRFIEIDVCYNFMPNCKTAFMVAGESSRIYIVERSNQEQLGKIH